jgi:hypothetical protein
MAELCEVIVLREIVVERARRPYGWFLVAMRDEDSPDGEYVSAWECAELAFAEAAALKRDYAPAIIRDRTGGAGL